MPRNLMLDEIKKNSFLLTRDKVKELEATKAGMDDDTRNGIHLTYDDTSGGRSIPLTDFRTNFNRMLSLRSPLINPWVGHANLGPVMSAEDYLEASKLPAGETFGLSAGESFEDLRKAYIRYLFEDIRSFGTNYKKARALMHDGCDDIIDSMLNSDLEAVKNYLADSSGHRYGYSLAISDEGSERRVRHVKDSSKFVFIDEYRPLTLAIPLQRRLWYAYMDKINLSSAQGSTLGIFRVEDLPDGFFIAKSSRYSVQPLEEVKDIDDFLTFASKLYSPMFDVELQAGKAPDAALNEAFDKTFDKVLQSYSKLVA